MVNPYEPTPDPDEQSDADFAKPTLQNSESAKRPRFVGGARTVVLIGFLSGAAMFGWGAATGTLFNDAILPLLGWATLFFAMNYAVIHFLRGVELGGSTKLGCALLLTPVSVILFVPVCFGAVVSLAMVSSTSPRMLRNSDAFQLLTPLAFTVIGFVIIAAVIAVIVRSWATKRMIAESDPRFRSLEETEDRP